MKILDLGSGEHPYMEDNADVVHVDNIYLSHVDLVFDVTKNPLPFKDSEFDKVVMFNFLEHLSPNEMVTVLKEVYRVVRLGGKVIISVPYHSSGNASGDPLHISQFSIQTLKFFDYDKSSEHPWHFAGFKFSLVSWQLSFHPWWLRWMEWVVKKRPGFYEYHLCYVIQPADLRFELEKV